MAVQAAHDPHSMQQNEQSATNTINVGRKERALSLVGGAAALIAGIIGAARGGLAGLGLSLLGGGYLLYRGVSGHCFAYQALNVNTAVFDQERAASVPHEQGVHIVRAVTINRPAEELYRFWRDFTNLPRFMDHLEAVHVLDSKRSHWIAKAPLGTHIEWDAEIVNEIENEVIGWRSLENAEVANAGSVRFMRAPGGRGTMVKVTLEYVPPAGQVGRTIAHLFGEAPEQQVGEDLARFKALLEAGEIATIQGQPSGRAKQHEISRRPSWRPAPKDAVQIASEQSFPASDAPAWTARPPSGEADLL